MKKNRRLPVTQGALLAKDVQVKPWDRLHVALDDEDHFIVTIKDVNRGIPSQAARVEWVSLVPEKKELDGHIAWCWRVAATDCTAIVIDAVWPSHQVSFEPDALLVYQYLLTTAVRQEHNLTTVARYREYAEHGRQAAQAGYPVPQFHKSLDSNGHPLNLSLYQDVASGLLVSNEGFAEFMEQGTGKTPTVIRAIDEMCRRNEDDRMLRVIVVCPKNVRANWAAEVAKFSSRKGRVTVLRGGALDRTKLLIEAMVPTRDDQEYTIVVCSYETLVRSWDVIGTIEWDLGVLDESHYIKWPTTKRSKFAIKLRDKCKKRAVLTGTPVTNTPLDLWAQLEFLGRGWSGFLSWKQFRKFYGVWASRDEDQRGAQRLVGIQNLPFMKERLGRLSFIIRKEEAMPDLPDKVYDVSEVEMTPEQQEYYTQLQAHLAVEIKNDIEKTEAEGRVLMVQNILTKLLRLAQITSGFMVFDPVVDEMTGDLISPREEVPIEPNAKLDGLIELLKSEDKTPDDKTIVWACWKYDLHSISRRLTSEGIDHVTFHGGTSEADRLEAERRFNYDPACRVFLGNPAAGGTGLNLIGHPTDEAEAENTTTNCTHVIYYSQGWSMPYRTQSEDRAHRRGTRQNVRITDLCVPGTIDEEIRSRVTDKRTTALEVQDLKSVLRQALGSHSEDIVANLI